MQTFIEGFINYLTKINNGVILSVTAEEVVIIPDKIELKYSAKTLFSLITRKRQFNTDRQQDVGEALTCIFQEFQDMNPNTFEFCTYRYRYTYRCNRCDYQTIDDILLGNLMTIPIPTASQLKFDMNAAVITTLEEYKCKRKC